jgi:drug/metabolite transporter (DMT)-like permease
MRRALANGPIMMFSSAVLFSIMAIMVKALSSSVPAAEIIFFRAFISVAIITGMIAIGKVKFKIKEKGKAAFRGIMGGISLVLYFNAITLTSVSNAVLLSYTSPIFASIFSNIYLKEKLTKEMAAFIICAFLGMFLIFQLDYASLNIGDLFALISGITSGIALVSIRELRKTESSWMIVLSFVFFGTIFSLFSLNGNVVMPSASTLFILLMIGIFGTAGQLFQTYAFKSCSTALGGVISMSSVVITMMLGILIFHDYLTLNMIIGAILIFVSATFFSLKEQYEQAK